MIQRKQTLFLLIVLGLLIAMLFLPLVEITISPNSETVTNIDGSISKTAVISASSIKMDAWGLYYDSEKVYQDGFIYFLVLLFLTIAAIITTIFSYRHRLFQIKLCYMIWIFLLGLMIFTAVFFYRLNEILVSVGGANVASNYSITAIFPIVSLILVWLAYRGIIKDESLVRSLDRLR